VVIEDELGEAVVLLHDRPELAALVDGAQVLRPADIALGERRELGELTVLVAIPVAACARSPGSR